MPDDAKSRASRSGEAGETGKQRAKGAATADRPFDMWLQKQLHAMYDEIASEPLPGDLLTLIDGDAAKSDEGADKPGKADGGNKAG